MPHHLGIGMVEILQQALNDGEIQVDEALPTTAMAMNLSQRCDRTHWAQAMPLDDPWGDRKEREDFEVGFAEAPAGARGQASAASTHGIAEPVGPLHEWGPRRMNVKLSAGG